MRFYLFVIFSVFCLNLQAGSVRLYNDTAHSLKATIRGADGSQLGEAVVAPQDSTPEGEYQETINKSMAMRKAIAMAESFGKAD